MSSNIKSFVKGAREAIDRKDYATALRLAEYGLAEDEKHYTLHVFRAISLQNMGMTEEAFDAFRMATNLQSSQPLAWQGLVAFLEEKERWNDMVEPLKVLIKLTKEMPVKCNEFHKKLIQTLENCGRFNECADAIQYYITDESSPFLLQEMSCANEKIELFKNEISFREKEEERVIQKEIEIRRYRLGADPLPILSTKVRNEIVATSNMTDKLLSLLSLNHDEKVLETIFQRLLITISMTKDCETVRKLKDLCFSWPNCQISSDILSEYFTDYPNLEDIKNIPVAPLTCESQLVPLLVEFNEDLFAEESEKIIELIKKIRCLISERQSIFETSLNGLTTLLDRFEGIYLAKSSKYQQAIHILERITLDDEEITSSLLDCYIATSNHQKAIELYNIRLNYCKTDSDRSILLQGLGWEYFLDGSVQKGLEYLLEAQAFINKTEDNHLNISLINLRLGIIYWSINEENRRDKSICLNHFLVAAKTDPNNFEPYLYIGRYYKEIENDLSRAERCFAKVMMLNPNCIEAALDLAFIWIYRANSSNNERIPLLQKVIEILEPFCEIYYKNSKMWTLFGIANEVLGRFSEASIAFLNALKGDNPDDKKCLLGLANSYRKMNRLLAASKAYEKVLQIDPANITANYGLAQVHLLMKDYESTLKYLDMVEVCGVLKDKIKLEKLRTLYLRSKEYIKSGLVNSTFADIDIFSDLVFSILQNSSSPSIVIKGRQLLGLFMAELIHLSSHSKFQSLKFESIISILEKSPHFNEMNEVWNAIETSLSNSISSSLFDLIKLTTLSHLANIFDCEDEAILSNSWFNLAKVLLITSTKIDNPSPEIFVIAKDFLEQTLNVECPSPEALALMGHIHMKLENYALCQHFYCLAIEFDPNCHSAHIGLSRLYTILGDADLAQLALAPVLVSEERGIGWQQQALISHLTTNNTSLSQTIIHTSDLSDACDHPAHIIAACTMIKSGEYLDSAEERIVLLARSLKRLAFHDGCPVALQVSTEMYKLIANVSDELSVKLNEIWSANEETLAAVKTKGLDEASIEQAEAEEEVINSIKNAISQYYELLASNLFIPKIWADLHYWHGQYSKCFPILQDMLNRFAEEWFRVHFTIDLVHRLLIREAIEATLEMWVMSQEYRLLLQRNLLFLSQFDKETLIK